jgi:hypothetical protein
MDIIISVLYGKYHSVFPFSQPVIVNCRIGNQLLYIKKVQITGPIESPKGMIKLNGLEITGRPDTGGSSFPGATKKEKKNCSSRKLTNDILERPR